VEVLVLFFGAILLGFGLIFAIAVSSPPRAPLDFRKEAQQDPLSGLDAEQLGRLVTALLDKMGLEIERSQGGKNEVVEIFATNPAPVTGGSILIHCITAPEDTGRLDGPSVGKFIRAVRSAYVSKGLLFTTGEFAPDARLEAEGAPVELFDRKRIHQMVAQHFEGQDPRSIA
jgi:hypothetical protein